MSDYIVLIRGGNVGGLAPLLYRSGIAEPALREVKRIDQRGLSASIPSWQQ